MGIFKVEETEPKPFKLQTTMSSTIECKDLHELAKMILWIDENIPKESRNVRVDESWGGTWKIAVSWVEWRG